MSEAYRSMYEDNMDQMRKAAKGAMQTIKFKDGKLKVDSFTASAIMGVHAKVNPKNRASIENMINSGTKAQIMKLQSLAMKSIKSENDPTVDEHANAKPHPHPHDPEDDEDKGELADVDEKKKQPVFKGTPAQIKKQMKDWKKKHDKVKIGEEVDLDEAKNYEIKNGKIHISKANFRKVHKDYKNSTKGKERMMALDPKSGATTSYEVVFEGTWAVPKSINDKNKLKDLLKKPIKLGKEGDDASDLMYNIIGDDELFDDLYVAGKKNPNGDARPIIKKAMKRLGIKEDLDEKFTRKDFDDNEDKNHHTENAVELVNMFGDNYEKRQIAQIKKDHDKRGHLVSKDQKVRDALVKKYLPKLKEEVELDEAKIAKKVPAKGGGHFVVLHRDTKGMPGKQDKFLMRTLNKGKVKDWGSHVSVDSALKFAKNRGIIDEVELDEAKSATGYELYHKTFSAAMQHAYAHAKKKFGITIKPSEIDDKVASGPRKPSTGKTNSYGLKGDKGGIQVQVYNTGKNYELNMYKEEIEEGSKAGYHDRVGLQFKPRQLKDPKKEMMVKTKDSGVIVIDKKDFKKYKKKGYFAVEETQVEAFPHGDGTDVPAMEIGTDRYRDYVKDLTPGETPVDEGSARADARRAMRGDPTLGKRSDKEDDDSATDDDVKAASKNIIMQMRKVTSLRGNFKVEFGNGKKEKLDPKIAQAVQDKYNSIKRPAEKEKFQSQIAKSKQDLLKALKESIEEGKMSEIDAMIKQGKSAKEIAKVMKVDVKTIKKLMSSYSVSERTLFRIDSIIKEKKNG